MSNNPKRFVRVRVDLLLDINRSFDSKVPFELKNLELRMYDFVEHGLRRHLPRRSNVKLVAVAHTMRSMTPTFVEKNYPLLRAAAATAKPIQRKRRRAAPKRRAKKGRRA